MDSVNNKFQITEEAIEVLSNRPTEDQLGELFEDCQFSPELEEYLFKCMDESNLNYLEVVVDELIKLRLL